MNIPRGARGTERGRSKRAKFHPLVAYQMRPGTARSRPYYREVDIAKSRTCAIWQRSASARHNGVFWLDQEERMKDHFFGGGGRSLMKIGEDKDEPME